MNLLTVHAAQADGIHPESSFLRTDVGSQMKLACRVAIHMAVEACDAEARFNGLSIICRIEFLLGERRQQKAQSIELYWRENVFEQTIVVVNRNNFAPR